MNMYAIYDTASGKIDRILGCLESEAQASCAAGESFVPVGTERDNTHYVSGGALQPFPASPAVGYEWDWQSKGWVLNLAAVKEAKWAEIKRARKAVEYGGFTHNGYHYDSDAVAQQRIAGAVSMAMLAANAAAPFSIDWTLADNTVITLSGSDMMAVGQALGTHVATQHANARSLRTQIEQATSLAEVEAVVWPS